MGLATRSSEANSVLIVYNVECPLSCPLLDVGHSFAYKLTECRFNRADYRPSCEGLTTLRSMLTHRKETKRRCGKIKGKLKCGGNLYGFI